jgi:uncharacterized membrane protein YidH (DUF202 family)
MANENSHHLSADDSDVRVRLACERTLLAMSECKSPGYERRLR